MKFLVWLISLFLMQIPALWAEGVPTVALQPGMEIFALESWTGYYEEPDSPPRAEILFAPAGDAYFTQNKSSLLSFGITSKAYWFKIRLVNRSNQSDWFLELGYPQLDKVSIFESAEGQGLVEKVFGDTLAVSARSHHSRQIVNQIKLLPGEEKTFLIRVYHPFNLFVPLTLYSMRGYQRAQQNEVFFLGAVFGVVLLGLLFSLSVYFFQRWGMFLYHSLFTVSVGSFVASMTGIPGDLFWQEIPAMNNIQYSIGMFLSLGFSAQFTRHFLRLWRWFPWMDRVLLGIFGLTVAISIFSPWIPFVMHSVLGYGLAMVCVTLFVLSSAVTWYRGDRLGRAYLICMSLVLVTVFLMFLTAVDLLGAGRWVIQMMQISLAGEVLMLAALLGNAIRPLASEATQSMAAPAAPLPLNALAPGDANRQEEAPALRLFTLGRMEAWRDNVSLNFGPRAMSKPQALLMELLIQDPEPVLEEAVCEALWPDADGDQARNSLKTTVFRLRQIIGPEVVVHQGGRVSLKSEIRWLDAQAFAAKCGELARQASSDPSWKADAARNLALYQGAFLKELNHPGVFGRRETLRRLYITLVNRLVEQHHKLGELDEAEALLRQGVSTEPLAEEFYQSLMRTYQHTGRWSEGVMVYKHLSRELETLLGVPPSEESRRIYQELREKKKVG